MGANDLNKLELSVGRWGNSLAVRLPAELARELGLREGSTLQLARNADQSFTLSARGARKPFDKAAGLDFFRRMFGYIHKSDFLMGRSGGFSCSLPWIVNDENFSKIIEGNYENKEVA